MVPLILENHHIEYLDLKGSLTSGRENGKENGSDYSRVYNRVYSGVILG